ncbi:MAG: threonine--tRNA ligase [bacterium]
MGKIETIRHSLAHILAYAVQDLWPATKFGIGPAIENGFYYDFQFPNPIAPEDLPKIEKKMRELIRQDIKFEKKTISKTEGEKLFVDQPYKLELVNEKFKNQNEKLTTYKSGDFIDLCAGPHIQSTREIPIDGFELTKLAGAYWRGSEKNPMLTRIYGVAFATKKDLEDYLKLQEEAEKRDHRILGKKLDLFTFSELVGSGLPLYTPKGALVRQLLNNYVEELQSNIGCTQVWTPQMAKADLFKTSGHYDKYKDSMFRVVSNFSEEEFFLKPMNCPQHTQIYASQMRSYRDLPLRYSDFAMLYRDEKPGELNGLARVRSFSQDDLHIFCREDQVDKEIDVALKMTKKIMKTFGFKYRYRLSTRDPQHFEKYIGDPKTWDKVEKWAEKIMMRNKIEYFPGPGEAAFYAPKMDLIATDALGREWQLSTVQIDFVMPERFDLTYVDEKGQKVRPVMIHRAIIGSAERFIMILLEHYAGAFPLWLSPVQVEILNITDKHLRYAKSVLKELMAENIRAELKTDGTVSKRIRQAELQKIPYILVLGDKEIKTKSVAVRKRGKGDVGTMKLTKFVKIAKEEIQNKK